MSQYLDEILPCLHLLFLELRLDILDGNEDALLFPHQKCAGKYGKVAGLPLAVKLFQLLIPVLQVQQCVHEFGRRRLQIANIAQARHFEEFFGRVIDQDHRAVRLVDKKADAQMLYYRIQISGVNLHIRARFLKFAHNPAEGFVQFTERGSKSLAGESLGGIVVSYGEKKPADVSIRLFREIDQRVYLVRGQQGCCRCHKEKVLLVDKEGKQH